jgi:hypothetical protein
MIFAILPVTGLIGGDHLLLRSPMTALLKLISIVPLFGFWYFYDIAQALGEREYVEKYGIAVPFYGPTGIGAGIIWRNQPHLTLSLNAEVDKIQLPKVYGNNNLILIAPKLEYNFNTKLFWTTFVQFNTQQNNFNINSRLQYRYKPMSDFFLVYTDNYFTDPVIKNKNRALIFKFNYWFNL